MASQGYGINSDNVAWAPGLYQQLYDLIMSTDDTYVKNKLCEFEASYDYEGQGAEFDDMFADFCEEYENPTYLWWNTDGVIADTIDEVAFGGRELFRYDDYCFYVDSVDALEAGISVDEIDTAIRTYFLPLCANEPRIDWYEIR